MNTHLNHIQQLLQQSTLPASEKETLLNALTEAEKQWAITDFELEQKRKAVEAQKRELAIESSLESVRTVAMGMNKADDMLMVCRTIAEQLDLLHVKDIRNVQTAIFYPAMSTYTNYEFYVKHNKPLVTEVSYKTHDVQRAFAEEMMKGPNEFYSKGFSGKEVQDWYNYQKTTNVFIDTYLENADSLTYYWFSLGPVALGMSTYQPLHEEQLNLFKRFRNVFELSYRRYLDIEKAASQARDAQIEASLERVRSRSMAMHKSEELKEVIRMVLEQLIHLNIKAEHAGFYIDYKVHDDMHIWLADPNLEPFYAVIPYFDTPTWNSFLNAKAKGITLHTDLLDFDEKNKFYKSLFQLFTIPEEAKEFYLQCKGLAVSTVLLDDVGLYIENFSAIPYTHEENKILLRFGKVFQQTYTRFLDLQKAEAHAVQAEQDLIAIKEAKQKAEAALTELQATQKQLIQSEKMASLGELTAGIAHEIQNPLNFVNNFSEVSNELIDEMNAELNKGDIEEAKAISSDIKQNLEKINHHGKRADAIVKGMLQHSRSSSGVKEPTDINKLVDEYLRLAYHGLRAKDKSFNATLKTDFDESIGNINIIPQDIGRVILNLITNAFYAVQEKSGFKNLASLYEPTVTVSTKKVNDKIAIKVTDNGNGIPKNIIDKIFQPFFTTKPTGQGTGLGLSLSYDIVKAHGGELKVETKVNEENPDPFGKGEGTIFIIQLPV